MVIIQMIQLMLGSFRRSRSRVRASSHWKTRLISRAKGGRAGGHWQHREFQRAPMRGRVAESGPVRAPPIAAPGTGGTTDYQVACPQMVIIQMIQLMLGSFRRSHSSGQGQFTREKQTMFLGVGRQGQRRAPLRQARMICAGCLNMTPLLFSRVNQPHP
jgi:hypothetical protein